MENENTTLTLDKLKQILTMVYDEQTTYPDLKKVWNRNNLTLGQCAVTALVVQYYFGGEIYKHNKISHYFNVINNEIIDLTKEQFNFEIDYENSSIKQPDISKAKTKERFELLLQRVEKFLDDERNIAIEIKNCNKCGNLPKLSCNSIKLGKSKILIIGESPAKDGWIVSGKAFYNKDGYLQASGKILDKLLKLCGLNIDDINFTEVCKCVISDRKTLRQCCANCKPILIKQLDNIDSDVIMPMGQFPTEVILGTKINKLSDVVGRKYTVNFGNTSKTVIPIYHTSPANPLCYKGNEKIFNEILNNLLTIIDNQNSQKELDDDNIIEKF